MSESPASGAAPPKGPSIAIGAAVYALLSVGVALLTIRAASLQTALGCVGCLVILAGPMLAVWHYTSTYRRTLLAGEGAGMGAITGAVGALISGVLSQLLILANVLPTPAEMIAIQRQQMVQKGLSPEQIASAMSFAEKMGGLSANPVVGTAVGVLLGALFGALFGMVAASVFKKGDAV